MGEIGRQGRRAVHGDGVVVACMAGIRRQPDTDDRTGKGSNTPPGNSQRSALI